MIKMGLIGAGLGFIYMMSLTFLHPFCTLCLAPFLGIGVGYGSGWLDHPLSFEASLIKGAFTGGITGFGVVLGQMLAAVVSGILASHSEQQPTSLLRLLQLFGGGNNYWQTILLSISLCSLFNLALIVGLGAAGSLIWFQRHQKMLMTIASS